MKFVLRFVLFALVLLQASSLPAQLPVPKNPLWEPIVDKVYLQEVPTLIPTEQALTTVAVHEGIAYLGHQQGLLRLEGETLKREPLPSGPVSRLKTLNGTLYAVSGHGLWRLQNGNWSQLTDKPVADLCLHNDQIVIASGKNLFALNGDSLEELTAKKDRHGEGGDLLGITSYSGTIYVHDGKQVGLLAKGHILYDGIADWGKLQRGCTVHDLLRVGSKLFVATNEGLGLLRGMTWYHITGEEGLCYEQTTSLATGFDRDLWIGTERGAIRHVNDEYQYFNDQRWLPNNHVNGIATGDQVVYIATNGGLSIIRYEPYTLAKKAAYYERWLKEWGMKRLGFVHILLWEDGRWVREVSDNDVGYSSHYLNAKCFEFAVTGNPEVRVEAVDMMKTVKWSEEITSVDGFPARSIYAVNEETHKAKHGSGGLPAEWHATPDGLWEWKGDTSSDEVDAHLYETTLFLSLVATAEEKVWATEHLRRVIGHIVDNGFVLRDADGKPTRWGRWDPEYLQTPYGAGARGLNGMEAFSYLTTALHFTGDEKFAKAKAYHLKQGYLLDILRQKIVFPPNYNTPFDDRLAFYAYYPLIQYETDPDLKSLWLRSLERSWEIKRNAAAPWFNFIYGAVTGNDCETDRAVDHLRGWPLDLRRYNFSNSHRSDLHMPKGYRMYAEQPRAFNPRETEPERWDGDFLRQDGSHGGNRVSDPSGWLDAYWMGRYYGMITPPQTDDPHLTTVPERNLRFGANPYDGPPRPKLKHEM